VGALRAAICLGTANNRMVGGVLHQKYVDGSAPERLIKGAGGNNPSAVLQGRERVARHRDAEVQI